MIVAILSASLVGMLSTSLFLACCCAKEKSEKKKVMKENAAIPQISTPAVVQPELVDVESRHDKESNEAFPEYSDQVLKISATTEANEKINEVQPTS